MTKMILIAGLVIALSTSIPVESQAQLKKYEPTPYSTTGQIVKEHHNSGGLFGDWNVKMSHSYSMNFSTFGGQTHNVNMYTNSLDFYFSERLTGDLDISLMHSPFGGGGSPLDNSSSFEGKVFINNAQLNYRLSDKASISVQFRQTPYGYGYGYGPARYGINNIFLN